MYTSVIKLLKLYLIYFLFSGCNSSSLISLQNISGTWITEGNETIRINPNKGSIDYKGLISNVTSYKNLDAFISNDTLRFAETLTSSQTNYENSETFFYDFKILEFDEPKLILKPSSLLAQKFFNEKEILGFTRQEFAVDANIRFEKLVFHASACYGECPPFKLEIDSNKHIKLFREKFFTPNPEIQRDSLFYGYFEGALDDNLYDELIFQIKTCNLERLELNTRTCCDGPLQTLIVYFNGKRKYLKSMFPPAIADKLILHL
ncbi:MAG: DUF6438 domain-containing protein [Saprospiraceae bacterium]